MENPKSRKARISIANHAVSVEGTTKSTSYSFGILNQERLVKGERHYKAFGRVALLNEAGKEYLQRVFHATDFEFDLKTELYAARFIVDEVHVNTVLEMFANLGSVMKQYERNPTVDIMTKLASDTEFPGFGCTASEAKSVSLAYLKSVRQNPPRVGTDTSERALDIPTYRLFRIYKLTMPVDLLDRFMRSPMVRILSNDELATTDGGSKAGLTSDGCEIQNNLFSLG